MAEIALAFLYIGLLVAAFVLARSIAVFTALVFVAGSFTGALVQFIAVGWHSFTLAELQIWVLIGLGLVLVGAVMSRRRHRKVEEPRTLIVGAAVTTAIVFLAARVMAQGSPEILSSVGYLISRPGAEDNAKWLNATSQLAQGTPLDTWASVGGPLVLVFTLCATLIGATSVVLYGDVNQVAVSAGTVVLAEHFLVVVAPFALAPLLIAVKRAGKLRKVPTPIALLAILLVVATVAWPLEFGHVTLQYVVLAFTLWIGFFLTPQTTPLIRAMVSIGIALTAMVWFPIAPVAIAVILGVIVWSIRSRQWLMLGAAGVAVVLVAEYLTSALRFSLGVSSASAEVPRAGGAAGGMVANGGVLPLFSSPGGTATASTMILIITAVSTFGAISYFVQRGVPGRTILMRFGPIVLLAGYAWAVTIVDFWAVGSGPNYASLKVVYTAVLPILVTTLILALLALDHRAAAMTPLRWATIGSILVIMTVDPFIARTAAQVRPSLWPSTSDFPYWAPAEVRATGEQPLTSNPIACVYLPPGSELPSALPFGQRAYSCSRLLAGLAGADRGAHEIVQWQLQEWINNENLWDQRYSTLAAADPTIRSRSVIILDRDGRVIGIEPFDRLLTRYAPDGA